MLRDSCATWLVATIAICAATAILAPVLVHGPTPTTVLTAEPDTHTAESTPVPTMVLPGELAGRETVRPRELATTSPPPTHTLRADIPDVVPVTRKGAGELVRRGSLLGRLRKDLAMLGKPDYASTVGSWYYDMPEDRRPPNGVVRDMESAFQLLPGVRLKPEEGAELARVFADQDWGALQASDGMSFVVAYLGVPRIRQELPEEQVRLLEYMRIIP